MSNDLTYIVQAPHQRPLKDRLTLAVRHSSGIRKLFKITFRPKTADFYVAFPYLTVPSYRCGLRCPSDTNETFDTSVGRDTMESVVPVKLSFHESGAVHFKAQDNAPRGGTSLGRTRSYPLNQLTGQHILTVEAEQPALFAEATEVDLQRKDIIIMDVPADCPRVKITAFAGYSVENVSNKYISRDGIALPTSTAVRFDRPHLPRPLVVGFYVVGGPTLQQSQDPQPSIIALAGFNPGEGTVLFLHANDPTRP